MLAKKDIQLFACLHNILKDINQQRKDYVIVEKIKNSAALYISAAISDNVAGLSV